MFSPVRWGGDHLELLDQRLLPVEVRWVVARDSAAVADAIRDMVVRGAPAIGIAAAYGLALAWNNGEDLEAARERLLASRPTAVHLRWALDRIYASPPSAWEAAAAALHAEDQAINRRLGDAGARLLPSHPRVYHHCNTGALATGGWGTALGIVRSAAAAGKRPFVYVGETRPWLQGARLTAWELAQEGVDGALVVDGAAPTVMASCDAALVGCDRVAANGDVANKIGTLAVALAARHHDVPLYVAMPLATLDFACPAGATLPIETRAASELVGYRGERWAADFPVFNPVFDVTPADLVTAWVTEAGLWWPWRRATELARHLGAWLAAQGLVPATSGNLALRAGRGLLVSPTGRSVGEVEGEAWVPTDLAGAPLDRRRPSAEALVHASLLARGFGCSLHAHGGPFTRASLGGDRTITGMELLKAFTGVSSHDATLRVPVVPNTQDAAALASSVARAADAADTWAVLVRGHGVYVWGDGPDDARRHLDALATLLSGS